MLPEAKGQVNFGQAANLDERIVETRTTSSSIIWILEIKLSWQVLPQSRVDPSRGHILAFG